MDKIRVAIAGLGNCASALVQGVHYYRNESPNSRVPGLMHVVFGDYHVRDLEFVAAFEVNKDKIGKKISDAIWVPPNCTPKFSDVPDIDVIVQPGPISDGVAPHMIDSFHCYDESQMKAIDVAKVLTEAKADVLVNFLPVGSEKATRVYAQACLDSGVSLANGIPTFIVSDPSKKWPKKFEEKGIPIAGDDIKSQIDDGVRHAAYRIIEGKGATYYGIGAGLAQIVKTIHNDQRRVLTVSSVTRNVKGFKGISLSLPRLVGAKGVLAELKPSLSSDELSALEKSAELLKTAAGEIGY